MKFPCWFISSPPSGLSEESIGLQQSLHNWQRRIPYRAPSSRQGLLSGLSLSSPWIKMEHEPEMYWIDQVAYLACLIHAYIWRVNVSWDHYQIVCCIDHHFPSEWSNLRGIHIQNVKQEVWNTMYKQSVAPKILTGFLIVINKLVIEGTKVRIFNVYETSFWSKSCFLSVTRPKELLKHDNEFWVVEEPFVRELGGGGWDRVFLAGTRRKAGLSWRLLSCPTTDLYTIYVLLKTRRVKPHWQQTLHLLT